MQMLLDASGACRVIYNIPPVVVMTVRLYAAHIAFQVAWLHNLVWAALLAILLLVGGVELNPGPTSVLASLRSARQHTPVRCTPVQSMHYV